MVWLFWIDRIKFLSANGLLFVSWLSWLACLFLLAWAISVFHIWHLTFDRADSWFNWFTVWGNHARKLQFVNANWIAKCIAFFACKFNLWLIANYSLWMQIRLQNALQFLLANLNCDRLQTAGCEWMQFVTKQICAKRQEVHSFVNINIGMNI